MQGVQSVLPALIVGHSIFQNGSSCCYDEGSKQSYFVLEQGRKAAVSWNILRMHVSPQIAQFVNHYTVHLSFTYINSQRQVSSHMGSSRHGGSV